MNWFKAFQGKKEKSYAMMDLISTLGLERRQSFRIRYPEGGALGELPTATFVGNRMTLQNVSVGGCCILDPKEILGPDIGLEISLAFHWPSDSQDIRARIVSRVDHRRHIQFANMDDLHQKRIAQYIEPSFRGSALRRVDASTSRRLTLEACEIWVSVMEESITLFNHPHLLGSIHYREQDYLCYRQAFPVFGNDRKRVVPPETFDCLMLFLANTPNPSPSLKQFIAELSSVGQDRFR
jgi:hypothetical protein